MSRSAELIDAQRRSEAVVTALVAGDRTLAAELVEQDESPVVLALVLADLAASLHRWRCQAIGAATGREVDPSERWMRFVMANRVAEEAAS